jgi:PKD repeat protein
VNEALNSVGFRDASTNAQEWFWDFGDGSFSADQNPTHTYAEPGLYVVYLAIYDNLTDCFAETVKEVQVGTE